MNSLIQLSRVVDRLAIDLHKVREGLETKEELSMQLSAVIAHLEVFTDANYTEQEQAALFQRSGQLLEQFKAQQPLSDTYCPGCTAFPPIHAQGCDNAPQDSMEYHGVNGGLEKAANHCDLLARQNERANDELSRRGASQLRAIASEIRRLKE